MLNDKKLRIKRRIQAKIGACPRIVTRKTLQFFYGEIADADKRVIFGSRIAISGEKFDANLGALAKKTAEFIVKNKIEKIAFDRNGYKYHGKVKKFADSLRESGVKI